MRHMLTRQARYKRTAVQPLAVAAGAAINVA